jgi:hypothetical protein
VYTQTLDFFCQFVIISEYCATIAITAERFSREKAGRGRPPNRANVTTLVGCAEALRRIA